MTTLKLKDMNFTPFIREYGGVTKLEFSRLERRSTRDAGWSVQKLSRDILPYIKEYMRAGNYQPVNTNTRDALRFIREPLYAFNNQDISGSFGLFEKYLMAILPETYARWQTTNFLKIVSEIVQQPEKYFYVLVKSSPDGSKTEFLHYHEVSEQTILLFERVENQLLSSKNTKVAMRPSTRNTKRISARRQTTKRPSTKRQTTKRPSTRRQTTKRTSTRRQSTKRKYTKRTSITKRQSTKRKRTSTKRKSSRK